MLTFLRKYQKFFFIIISVVTIASFSFFGTFSGYSGEERAPDREVGKAIDGSAIMERELDAMERFLSSSGGTVIQDDLIATGLAAILGERYFADIKPDLQKRIERARHFKPYTHPQAPFISAEEVWNRFIPQLPQRLAQLKASEANPEAFALLCRIFLDQAAFPPEILTRILMYQQQQYSWIQPDAGIHPQRLALFGYQTAEDWLGSKFMEAACSFLINAAKIAEERGYSITAEEARADLLQHALQTLQTRAPKKEHTYADAAEFLQSQLLSAGVDEASGVKVWKKVLLFRRLFNDVGTGVIVDPLTYGQFSAYAGEKATVDLYRLPEPLRFFDLRSFFKFQLYLEAISPKSRGAMTAIPSDLASVEDVEKRFPECVQSRFHLEVAKVSRAEIAQKITLKETWDWEVSDAGWEALCSEFSVLAREEAASREERLVALDAIEETLRLKIDEKARACLISLHPEWCLAALNRVELQDLWVGIRSKGAVSPFDDIEETAAFTELLYAAPIGEKKLYTSPGQETYYLVAVLEKPAKKEVMTFAQALEGDLLDALLDRKLEEAYPSIRKREPSVFQLENGSWKPFKDVKDQVGLRYFADGFKKSGKQGIEEAALHALEAFVSAARASLKELGTASPFIQATGNALRDQWLLERQEREVKRSDHAAFAKEAAFALKEGEWSDIHLPANGDLSFFCLLKREKSTDSIGEQMEEGQRILSMDAKRLLMHQILDRIGTR